MLFHVIAQGTFIYICDLETFSFEQLAELFEEVHHLPNLMDHSNKCAISSFIVHVLELVSEFG